MSDNVIDINPRLPEQPLTDEEYNQIAAAILEEEN